MSELRQKMIKMMKLRNLGKRSPNYGTRKVRKLPTVLTQEEVRRIINAPKNMKHRLLLMTTYSAGLRTGEVIKLKPEHIDSKRMLIKVEEGKGGKDRYTLLSKKLLKELRHHCPAPLKLDHLIC